MPNAGGLETQPKITDATGDAAVTELTFENKTSYQKVPLNFL